MNYLDKAYEDRLKISNYLSWKEVPNIYRTFVCWKRSF